MSWISRLSEVELPEPETPVPPSEANAVGLSYTKPSDWALSLFGNEAAPESSSNKTKTSPWVKAISKRQRCTETWDCRRVSQQRLPKSSMTFFEPASEEDVSERVVSHTARVCNEVLRYASLAPAAEVYQEGARRKIEEVQVKPVHVLLQTDLTSSRHPLLSSQAHSQWFQLEQTTKLQDQLPEF